MITEEQLQAKRDRREKLYVEIKNAEHELFLQKQLPEILNLKGTHWRYRNCYSCPEKPSDYWFIYRKITEVSKGGDLTFYEFQTDKHGMLRIDFDKDVSASMVRIHQGGWTKVSKAEFEKQKKKMIQKVKDLK